MFHANIIKRPRRLLLIFALLLAWSTLTNCESRTVRRRRLFRRSAAIDGNLLDPNNNNLVDVVDINNLGEDGGEDDTPYKLSANVSFSINKPVYASSSSTMLPPMPTVPPEVYALPLNTINNVQLEGCNRSITVGNITGKLKGNIWSQNFLEDRRYYANNLNCFYRLQTIPGQHFKIKFTVFGLEYHEHCRRDFISFYNGLESTSPLIGKFCGSKQPTKQIRSQRNFMLIHFKTNRIISHAGWKLEYSVEKTIWVLANFSGGLEVVSGPAADKVQMIDGAKVIETDVATRGAGYIVSPGYPISSYPNSFDQMYRLLHSEWKERNDTSIRLVFNHLKLEAESEECSRDYLVIYDGPTPQSPLLGRYCGWRRNIPPVYSLGDSLLIHFHSDSQQTEKSGFNISYSIFSSKTSAGHQTSLAVGLGVGLGAAGLLLLAVLAVIISYKCFLASPRKTKEITGTSSCSGSTTHETTSISNELSNI